MDQFQDEFIKAFYEAAVQELDSRNDDDYEVDKVQMAKLIRAYRFFSDMAKRDGGRVEPFNITPKMEHSGITAYFTVFFVEEVDMPEFREIVGDMSVLSINAMLNGDVCISFNIPNVFRPKQQ